MIHETHWERLATLAPEEVCRRSGADHDPATGCYTLPLLDRRVQIDPAGCSVAWCDGDSTTAGHDVTLLSVVYLMEAKEIAPAGEWVTAESLPSGSFFFRGLHVIPTAEVADRFGDDRDGFIEAGRRLGGASIEGGDACIQIQVLPRIALRLVLWLGDEDFPAQATMLFDGGVHEHMPLDALLLLAKHVARALVQAAG